MGFPFEPLGQGLVYNVVDYGADPTGTNDSTAAIQQAYLSAVNSGGGEVYLPAGIYGCKGIDLSGIKTSVPVTIIISGAGMYATIMQVRNSNNLLSVASNGDYTPADHRP